MQGSLGYETYNRMPTKEKEMIFTDKSNLSMFVFIDESGLTKAEAGQKFLVIACCVCNNKKFAEDLINGIRDECKAKGKAVLSKEIKYHDISRFQQEIAIKRINKNYKNFYLAFMDIDSADKKLTSGKDEDRIQKNMLELIATKFESKLREKDSVVVFVDEKLKKESIAEIHGLLCAIRGSKKGLRVEARSSKTMHGLQLADLIAGAYRFKLLKKSDLLEVDDTHIFQCTPEMRGFSIKGKAKEK